ncbi:MAG: hypothetical protein AAB221_01450 [Bacteroidota bacterium]
MKASRLLLCICLLFVAATTQAQVAIGIASPAASAMLDVTSTSKGMLIPRMTTTNRTAIASPATGLQVYDTDLNQFYFYNGTAWTAFANNTNYWTLLSGNIYNNTGTNVGIGTTTPGDKLEVNGNIRLSGTGTILAAPSTTGSANSITLRAGDPYVPNGGSGGSVNITATNNMPAGGSGWTNLGTSGAVNITAGSGYNSAGGNVNITAGQSSYWGLTAGTHSDVIVKGGYNINSADAGTITAEGGYILSGFNSTTSTGGNLVLTPGTGANSGGNGSIKLDGIVAISVTTGLAGGTSGSPVSLLNQKSFISVSPADNTNNYYQLPNPATYPGRMYIIRNNSGSFNVNITTAAGSMYAGNSNTSVSPFTLSPASSPKTVMIISDGTNWIVMKQD